MDVALVIPCLNEEETIGSVIQEASPFASRILVADNGSTDNTVSVAMAAGAEVTHAATRGYGAACQAALLHFRHSPPFVVAFASGDGSDPVSDIIRITFPILEGRCDLVIGVRVKEKMEPGSMTLVQRAGNRLVVSLINAIWGGSYSDLGPFRAVRWDALLALGMEDMGFAWTVEMQVKALKRDLRIEQVPVGYRVRRGGRSKISGSLWGTLTAGTHMLKFIGREAISDLLSAAGATVPSSR